MTPLLTFDDGPSAEWTPAILDLLAEYEQRAAFFAIGAHANARPEVVSRVHAEGHSVGVHTWTHPKLTEGSRNIAAWELRQTAIKIEEITGEQPGWWRPPYFATTTEITALAMELGLAHMGANLIPDDWRATDAEELAARVLAGLRPQSVVCLHDGIPPDGGSTHCTDSRQVTVDALRLILAGMRA